MKNRWPGPVAGRAALARHAGAFEGGRANGRLERHEKQMAGGPVAGGHGRKRRLQNRFHTCGGPRRRPCLGEGRGRRILLDV